MARRREHRLGFVLPCGFLAFSSRAVFVGLIAYAASIAGTQGKSKKSERERERDRDVAEVEADATPS